MGQDATDRLVSEILDKVAALVVVLDREGRIIGFNRACEEVTGHRSAELCGRWPWEIQENPDEADHVRQIVDRLRGGESPVYHERVWATRKGERRRIAWSSVARRDEDGALVEIICTGLDVTERQQAAEAREQALGRQRAINRLQEELLGPGTLGNKLGAIAATAVAIFAADLCRIWLIRPGDLCDAGCIHAEGPPGQPVCEDHRRCLYLVAGGGRYTHLDGGHARVPFGLYKVGRVAAGVEDRFLTNDAAHDPEVEDHDWVRELGLVAFAVYKLADVDGQPLGGLALFSHQPISDEEDAALQAIANTSAQVVQTARVEAALHRRDAILEAVSYAAERFLETHSWQDCIPVVLERLGNATGVSRVQIFQNHTCDDGTLTSSPLSEWVAPEEVPRRGDDPALQAAPWAASGFDRWTEWMTAGWAVYGNVAEFPESERAALVRQGIRSLAALPIVVDGQWWGVMRFDACTMEQCWPRGEVDALKMAAETLGAAILRQNAEAERLAHAQRQRDTLVREVHHRIKNNLQGVVGLLRRHQMDRPETSEALEAAIAQIQAVATVHGLQGGDRRARPGFCDLVNAIVAAAYGRVGIDFRAASEGGAVCRVSGDGAGPCKVEIASSNAVPLALVVNELVTNGIKHSNTEEVVEVALTTCRREVRLTIRNRGKPLPPGLDLMGGRGIGTGLSLVLALLPREGASLALYQDGEWVVSELVLTEPAIHP
jgi:PAS domain S-box-containing protein